MAHLTVVGGSARPLFTFNSHGIAQFKLATRYAARRIVEAYAFPEESKPKRIQPSPAKELVYAFHRSGQKDDALNRAIERSAEAPPGETAFEKGRRRSMLRAAKHLRDFGNAFPFHDVRQRSLHTVISGLRVRVSLDFLATLDTRDGPQTLGVIYNVAEEISDHPDQLKVYAQIEGEVAFRVLREHISDIAAVWYIDLLGERVVKRQVKPSIGTWKEVETVCDDILIAYRVIAARRSREERRAT